VRPTPKAVPVTTRMRSRLPAVLPTVLLVVVMVAAAAPANATGGQPKPLTSRRLFEQSRPGVQLITVEFSAGLGMPEPIVTAANARALQTMAADRIRRGEIPATQAAARGAIVEEMAREPFRWFTASSKVHRTKVKLTATGSGFSITPDGYIITSAHVVAQKDDDIKTALLAQELRDERDDFVANVRAEGLTQTQATKFLAAIVQWATRMATFTNFQRSIAVLGSTGSGSTSSSKRRAATLVDAGEQFPGKDVALIKVAARNMATVPLGDDTALSTGDRLFVLGFPGPATFNPTLSKASQREPTLTQGVLSAKKVNGGYTVLQTDAGMTHGNSGGPVLDEQGKMVGVATAGSVDPKTGHELSGPNFAVPASIVNELLHKAHVSAAEGEAGRAYRQALDAIDRQWYERSLPLLDRVKALDPGHPLVAKLIKDSQTAIDQGRDRTPVEILGLPVLVVASVAGVAVVVLVGFGVLVLRSRRRHGAPRSEPVFPIAGEDTQPEPAADAALGPAPPAPADPPWVMPPASANPAGTRALGSGAPEYAQRNRDWQQSWWTADASQTVEVPATGNAEPASVPRAILRSRQHWRRWRVTGAVVGVVLVLVASGLLVVLRPWSHTAVPGATTAPTRVTTAAPATTGPPAATAPRATRARGPVGRVVAEVRVPDGLALTVPAVGGGSVWALALDTEVSAMLDPRVSLARVDPASNRVTARIPVPGTGLGGVVAMAYGTGSVWLVDSDQASHNVVSKVDPGRKRVVDRITVGLQPVDIAFTGQAAWVLNSVDETVSRIDPTSDKVVATVRLPDLSSPPRSVAATASAVWLPDADLGLVRIDPGTNRAMIVSVPGCCSGPVTAAAGAIWAADSRSGTLLRFEPASHRIVRIRLDDVVDLVTDGDQVAALGHSQVTWIDPSTNRVTGVVPVGRPDGIAGGDGMIWVADLDSKSLKRLAAP
jgi:serine protease Do